MGEQVYISHELDYKKQLSSHPTYKLNKVLPLTGSQQTTLSAAGGNDTLFEIPAYDFNFAKSRFDFQLNIAPSATATYAWIFKDVIGAIRQIQVYTRAGLYLMDIPYFNDYTKITRKPFTKVEKYLDYPRMGCDYNSGQQGANGGYYGGSGSFLQRNNDLANADSVPILVNAAPVTYTQSSFSIRPDNTSASLDYTEPQYLEVTTIGNGAGLINYQINVSIPFYSIKKCLLALDKDLYFGGETLIFRVIWDSTSKIGFLGTDSQNPTTGATTFVAGNVVTIKAMTLYIAQEVNPSITTALRNQVSTTGLSVLTDYVYPYKNVVGASTSQSLSFRFNRGHGRKLKYIVTSMINQNETTNNMYDTSNVAVTNTIPIIGSRLNYFYTLLNNVRLQEFNLTCSLYDDWNMIKDQIKGSVIQDTNMYYYNWFWCDNFASNNILHDDDEQNLDTGLPLDTEQKWDVYYTLVAANAYNHYTFAITQKMLTINTQGITII